ncbi:MAG: glycosyltransferase family 2 protein [Bacteroidales bacterium]|nr:glycosyltransferase family 2 protein [Bacteroidales bacterium]
MKLISIITPVFNEEDNIKDCYFAVKNVFETHLKDYNYEHIFADNASTDNSLRVIKEIAATDKRVKIIVNSRNFGASKSSFNSLMYAKGDAAIYTIAADLQDPPDMIPDFIKKWESGYQIVYGVRETREENSLLTFIRKRYYRMVRSLSEFDIPNDVGDFQLLDKIVVDNLRKYDDYFPYVRGLIAQTGFDAAGIKYKHKKRIKGKAKGTLYPIIDLGINGLVSFTNIPLRIATISGFFISILSVVFALVQLVLWIINTFVYGKELAAPGLTTLILGMFLFFGITLFFIGILGEYIGAIHAQVRKGPTVIVREKVNFDD